MKTRAFISRALFLFGCGLLVACNSPAPGGGTAPSPSGSAANSKAIALGAALARTSNVALLGQEQVIGVEMAEKYFNEKGGVNGTAIEVIVQDTAGDEQGAINAINTLIAGDKVVGIVGPSLSQQAFAASPIADRAKVPILGPSNTARGIPQIGEYVGRVSAPMTVVAPKSIEAALKIDPKIRRIAVFYAQNDAFSKSETETFQQTLKDSKLDIVTVQKFQTTDTDFQSQATAAINLEPDLIVISGLVADGGNLVKQLRQLGYKGPIVGGNGLNSSNLFPVCQAYCDGLLVAQAYSPELDTPINKDFVAAYEARTRKLPPQFTAQAFTGIQVFVEALKRVDDRNKLSGLSLEEIRRQLNQEIVKGKYNTVLGEIAFTPEGEILQDTFYVARVKMAKDGKNGKFIYLK